MKKMMDVVWWKGCEEPNTSYRVAKKMLQLTNAKDAMWDQRLALIVHWRKIKTRIGDDPDSSSDST